MAKTYLINHHNNVSKLMFLYNRYSTPLTLLAFLFTFSAAQAAPHSGFARDIPDGIFGYRETVGDKITPFSWEAEEQQDGIIISVNEEGKSFYNLCSSDGATHEWRIQVEDKHDITAVRTDNILEIQGIRFGEKYHEQVEIDDRPWYQPLSFSLRNFLSSDSQKTSFWVIRADKIEVIALTAEKLGVEKVTVDDQTVSAQKIEVRAEGFYSKFWFATYWYRESDNLFIRYQSVHGLPGTDETVVELIRSPRQLHDT